MKRDIGFLTSAGIVMLTLVVGIFIRGKNEKSIIENRALADFPKFSIDSFMNNSYQNNIEVTLTDQILFGESFKSIYNTIKNNNLNIVVSTLKELEKNSSDLIDEVIEVSNQDLTNETITTYQQETGNTSELIDRKIENILEQERKNLKQSLIAEGRLPGALTFETSLTPKGNGFFQIDDSGHLIVPKRMLSDASDLFKAKANNYNELVKNYPELPYDCYYIETDVDIDFINGKINHDLVKSFFEQLDPSIEKGALYINNPTDFKKYFYKTDHHWDVGGQLKGYKDIIRILKGEDEETVDIKTELIEDAIYYGYKSRTTSDYSISDEFHILISDLPEHKVFINGVEGTYDRKNAYLAGNFSKEKGANHYGICNGGDYGLVEYKFSQPDKEDILVFVDSFSNPINGFIASHFNNTYFIDIRYYEKAYEKKFDFGDFVKENDIDKVLFTGYYFFYANNEFLITD